jgi:excisionase family DNA binding protein
MDQSAYTRVVGVIRIEGEEYYTSEEACVVLGVKPATLYSYVNRGLVTSYRQNIRRHRLYRRSEIDALLEVTAVERDNPTAAIPLADSWAHEH